MTRYASAEKPTLTFIGVTTGRSSIMKVFPEWARYLGLGDVAIRGWDFPPHAPPENYREAVEALARDPLALGALVTTHKMNLLAACRDRFDQLDEHALRLNEISCISKQDGRLVGHAKDPISAGLSLEAFLPRGYWEKTGAGAFVIGAGGSSNAVTWHMMQKKWGADRPSRLIVSNRSQPRLDELREAHEDLDHGMKVEYHLEPKPEGNDAILASLRPGSLVINATGLGKDAPGSPLTDGAVWPEKGIAWEFNYRGDLIFLKQAEAARKEKGLQVEDGWIYFIHGWTRVIAEVFHIDIPAQGPALNELSRIAADVRKGTTV